MKKGLVITLSLSHKNMKHIFKANDKVTENDVNNFDLLVEKGFIKDLTEHEDTGEDLTRLNKAQLQEKCDELKLSYEESNTKAQLRVIIQTASE